MKDDRVRYFAENMDRLSRRDRVFLNNPVIMQGLGLAPIVIPANSVMSAAVLAMGVLLLLTPTRIIATLIGQHVGFKMRAVVYALTAGVVFIAVAYIMESLFGTQLLSVGIYLPLLVMEPLIVKRFENPQKERIVTSFKKGILTTIGFCLVLFIMAALREVLALGTLGGIEIFRGPLLPMASMPAGGFILLGVVAAIWRAAVNAFKKNVSLGVKKLP
ncbi:MAG: electron transporter RnfE [Ruminococcaceae bacterium]|nr:electron transporter RnfE [Oscillospiraceae bacterium]